MRDYQALIRDYFADPLAKPLRPKELAQELDLHKNDFQRFKDAIEELVADGKLLVGKNKLVRSAAPADLIAGTVKRTGKGTGYFRPHDLTKLEPDESLYISPEDLKDAFTGDEVLVQLLKRHERGQRCGRVIEIVSRGSQAFVGTYLEQRHRGFVRIDGNQFEGPISVGDPGAKGVQPEDRVVVEMLRFPSRDEAGEAVITKVLGPRGTPGVDLQTIIAEFDLPDEFPEAVLEEARLQAQMFEEEQRVESGEARVESQNEAESPVAVDDDSRRAATVVPSPQPVFGETNTAGERARVRGASGESAHHEDSTQLHDLNDGERATGDERRTPHPNPLPSKARGEGTGEDRTSSSFSSGSPLSSLRSRLDLTNELIITIDPIDARDFDDAISLTREDDGNWRLGVHIADVAHFVRPGTLLDREAHLRGTSVYLPDKVLPMLPEVISNALASLQQGRVRFTKSAFVTFSPEGVPLHSEFANSKIRVTQRFAYEQVMPLIAGSRVEGGGWSVDGRGLRVREENTGTESGAERTSTSDPQPSTLDHQPSSDPQPAVEPRVLELLQRMHTLAMILRQRRFAHGALDLNLPEIKIDMTREGKVAGAHRVGHDESHQIIEEFMLAANIAVATKLADCGLNFLRRTHAAPDERKLRVLGEFAKSLGYKLHATPGRADLQKLLKEVHGTPQDYAISYALLRSMKQATYSPVEDIGHYALAEDNYCHFTSPIRRYPDLTVHRLLDEVIRKEGWVDADEHVDSSRRATTVVPSPRPCGERARVRGFDDGDGVHSDAADDSADDTDRGNESAAELRVGDERRQRKTAKKTPLPNPLPAKPGRGDKTKAQPTGIPEDIVRLGVWCSMTERRAQDAERELIKLKLLTYLADRVGEEMHATITGVEKFGLFCTGIELPAEGLVHISTMGDDHYDYDERLHTLVGRRSNRTYRLGDFIKVVVAKVDLAERKLEMRIVVEERDASSEFRRRESQSRLDREAPRHGSQGPKKRGRRR